MDWKEIIGLVAATCTTVAFIPQAYKVLKTGDTSAISKGMYSIFTFGTITWTAYGFLTNNIPVILANIITAILATIILVYKIKKG